jgi:hypothetical protein
MVPINFKSTNIDASDLKSNRPIYNLPILLKLMEFLVARQLNNHLSSAVWSHARLQSAYRHLHSTETAVLKVASDILRAVDRCDIAALALLDLSTSFAMVDHATLLCRLAVSFGLRVTVLLLFVLFILDSNEIDAGTLLLRHRWSLAAYHRDQFSAQSFPRLY